MTPEEIQEMKPHQYAISFIFRCLAGYLIGSSLAFWWCHDINGAVLCLILASIFMLIDSAIGLNK